MSENLKFESHGGGIQQKREKREKKKRTQNTRNEKKFELKRKASYI